MPIFGRGVSPAFIREGGTGVAAIQAWHNGELLFDGTVGALVVGSTGAVTVAPGPGVASGGAVVEGITGELFVTSLPGVAGAGATAFGETGEIVVTGIDGDTAHGQTADGETAEIVIAGGAGDAVATPSNEAIGDTRTILVVGEAGIASAGATVDGATGAIAVTGIDGVAGGGFTVDGETSEITIVGVEGTVTAGATVDGATGAVVVAGIGGVAAAGQTAIGATGAITVTGVGGDVTTAISGVDSFNRASLGADWVPLDAYPPVLAGNRAQGGTNGPSNTSTAYRARHVRPFSTNDQEVTQYIVKPYPNGVSQSYAAGSEAWLRGSSDGSTRVSVIGAISGTTHTIYIVSYQSGTGTSRASSTAYKFDLIADESGSTLRLCPTGLTLRAVGNVYTVYLNDQPTTVSWTDSGNLIPQTNRYHGIGVYTSENSGGSATYSPAIAQYEYRDYVPTTPVWQTYPWMQPGFGSKLNGFGYYSGSTTTFHNGVDITGPTGRNIYAAADGVVVLAGGPEVVGSGYGNGVSIWHEGDVCTDYAHMSSVLVTTGQVVSRGDVIGLVGNTGNSTQSHLHFAVRRGQNPFSGADPWILDTQFPYQDPERFLTNAGVSLNWAVDPG